MTRCAVEPLPRAALLRGKICLLAWLLLPALAPHAAAADRPPDGRAVFVRELATAEVEGLSRILAAKDLVYVEDTLRTSDKALARFVMRDRTMLAMKPGSVVRLAEYEFKADGDADKMVTEAVSGGLRVLTGLVDKRTAQNVKLKTPLSTIGIRGTALRIDVFPDGKEEVVFDLGHGWVRNAAGSVDVPQGWGARVISERLRPELFQPDQDDDDPATLALLLAGRAPPDIARSHPMPPGETERLEALAQTSSQARRIAATMDAADRILLVGMLDQIPEPDEAVTLAVLEGILAVSAAGEPAVLSAAVQLAPERAAVLLGIAVEGGTEIRSALDTVLGAVQPFWPEQLDGVLDQAEQLGLSRQAVLEVMRDLRQPVPCRTRPATAQPGADGVIVDDYACSPESSLQR
jgi:hypothetical protein